MSDRNNLSSWLSLSQRERDAYGNRLHTYAKYQKYGYNPLAKYSNYSSSLDAYMAELEKKYGNTEFWQEFTSNPYLSLPSVTPDNWEWNLGRDYWADAVTTQEQKARETINQIIQKYREQEFNSASNQVAREKAAGLNPDLNGGVGPGEATEGTELPSTPLPSVSDYFNQRLQQGQSIAQAGLGFVQTMFGLAGQMQSLNAGSLQNANLFFQNLSEGDESVANWMVNHMAPPSKDGEDSTFLNRFHEALKVLKKNYPMSHRSRRFVNAIANALIAGNDEESGSILVSGKFEELANKFIRNRMSRAREMSDPLFSDDFQEMLGQFSDGYSQLCYDVWKLQNEAAKLVSDFQVRYYTHLNNEGAPETAASLENEQNINALTYEVERGELGIPRKTAQNENESIELNKLMIDINKKRQEAIDKAEKEFKIIQDKYLNGDKWYHVLGRIALPILRDLVTKSVTNYFDSAMSTLGQRTFEAPAPPNVRNTNVYNTNYLPGAED